MDNVFEAEGYLSSLSFVDTIAKLHRRKAEVNTLKKQQDEILRGLSKNDSQRDMHVTLVNRYIAEQGTINEKIKEFSVCYKASLDQILIEVIRVRHPELLSKMLTEAKNIYATKNKRK